MFLCYTGSTTSDTCKLEAVRALCKTESTLDQNQKTYQEVFEYLTTVP
jgi:hypothetical protein